ncbi:MAG TPA: low-specificity L-threonine aldolase [Thermomicrobiales bacterium]|nr:low-specificity L-threonine aldolase [Thermomicrobiales bacterium]
MSTTGYIDLRSDTVTHPTDAMRRAMAAAEVGDDQYREDPTVARLEERAAELFGMEAALFVASGTMGNLVALLTHCGRGEEVILGDQSHIVWYENSGAAVLGGIVYQQVLTAASGELELDLLAGMIRTRSEFNAPTRLIAIENTHNRRGGTVLSMDYLRGLRQLANDAGVRIHMDGARVFNAAVASGHSLAEIAGTVDTIQFCLSKGLAAPVGSMIAGPRDFIEVARQRRRLVGGAMRQAGVIAAAGLVALEEMCDRLADDHARARRLAEGLAAVPGVTIDLASVQSNIIVFRPPHADFDAVSAAFRAEGILCSGFGALGLRMVTHYQIDDAAIDRTLAVANQVLAGRSTSPVAAD